MQKIKNIIIFGAGGNARDIIDTISEINDISPTYNIIGILDDNELLLGTEIMGVKVLGSINSATSYTNCYFINGIYSVINFFVNKKIIKRANIPISKYETIIHPTSSISRTSKVGKGSFIARNVVIMSDVILGKHVTVHPGSIISHNTTIGDFSFVANSASLAGYINIGVECFIGANCTIRERVTIGNHTIIGMGSVVLEDVPNRNVFVGNPARFLKNLK